MVHFTCSPIARCITMGTGREKGCIFEDREKRFLVNYVHHFLFLGNLSVECVNKYTELCNSITVASWFDKYGTLVNQFFILRYVALTERNVLNY